jgi:hypothetical protein
MSLLMDTISAVEVAIDSVLLRVTYFESSDGRGGDEVPPHPDRDEIALAAVLHALSDPVRLRIVREVAADGGERSYNSFNRPIAKSTLVYHFKVQSELG